MTLPRAYSIVPTADHLGDMTYDVSLIRARGVDPDRVFFAETSPISLPEPLRFVANFGALRGRDFPVSDPADFPIMSRDMLNVLLEVHGFEHRGLACRMVDDTATLSRPDGHDVRPGTVDDRYVALHLTTHVEDAFDWDLSTYERDDDEPARLLAIEKLVLNEVPLPPVFRLAPYPRVLFVSADGRSALQRAGVRGVHYIADSFVV